MHFKEVLTHIRAFIFDVDGVFTDGGLYLFPDGQLLRKMNIKDGYAIRHAVNKGFKVAIVSGGTLDAIKIRFENLGVTDIYLGVNDKMPCITDFFRKYQINPKEVVYMGDDIPDLEVMKNLSITACPADASTDIKEIAFYISSCRGGEGCVRDLIEQVLRAQSKWL